jgi:hypothetical protein
MTKLEETVLKDLAELRRKGEPDWKNLDPAWRKLIEDMIKLHDELLACEPVSTPITSLRQANTIERRERLDAKIKRLLEEFFTALHAEFAKPKPE